MKKTFSLLMSSLIVISIITLISCEKKDNISLNIKEKEKKIALSKEKDNIVDLNIYFDSSKDSSKPEISQEERVMKKDEILGEIIMSELIKGPSVKSRLKPILPKESKILSFSIKDNIAYVNLSNEANIEMTANKEELCLKSIVWSLTQIPSVEKVKILIENKDTGLWGGHFDLTKPIGKDDFTDIKRN